MTYPFPFEKIHPHATVVLYGMGAVGTSYLQQLQEKGDYTVSFALDQRKSGQVCNGVSVLPPEQIDGMAYDYVVIALADQRMAEEVRQYLLGLQVPEGKIIAPSLSQVRNDGVDQYDLNNMPLFTELEIETINRCNSVCPFCVANANAPQRPYAKMSRDLFEKLIMELHDLDYDGNIGLYSNNEPFLDDRIIDFYKYTREKLPRAYLHMYTNGTLLTKEKYKEIIPFMDRMVIDIYNDSGEMPPNLKLLYQYCTEHPAWMDKTVFNHIQLTQVRASRGGTSPNKEKQRVSEDLRCLKPFQQVVVRPDGKLSLCCCDPLGAYTLGDANCETLASIWTSGKYHQIREIMKTRGRTGLKHCEFCDDNVMDMGFVRGTAVFTNTMTPLHED